MPAIRMMGPPRIKAFKRHTVFDDQSFIVIGPQDPPRPYNAQHSHYLGEPGWVYMECRPGERRPEDGPLVDRIGLDGWIDPLPLGDRVLKTKFSVVFLSGCVGAPGHWLNFFEVHAFPLKGIHEHEGAGPIRLGYEWSFANSCPTFRVYTELQIYDANGLAIGGNAVIRFQADQYVNPEHALQEGVRYDFEVHAYSNDTDGFLHIWKDGVKIVDLNNTPFGYGVERRQYVQWRIYRATRNITGRMLVKIHEVTFPKIPDLPGVTRGPELLRDGRFHVNAGAWLDINSDPGCSMVWESDGEGGGFMRSQTLSASGDLVSNARFKRRLDILEIGETYELKHRGTFGLAAAKSDGGYFGGPNTYLPPAQGPEGAEIARQFRATSETLFLGNSNSITGRTLDGVSLKRVVGGS